MIAVLCPKHFCLLWLPSALLQRFFLLLLALTCVTGNLLPVDSSTEAAPERARLPLQPLPKECRDASLGLVQTKAVPTRKHSTEEEHIVAMRKEEVSGKQSVPRRSLFGTLLLKLNHTASNRSDNNSSDGSWLNMWIGFQKLNASLLSSKTLVLRHVSAASMRTTDMAFWMLSAALLLVGVLACVCLRGKRATSSARASSSAVRPPDKTPSVSCWQRQKSRGSMGTSRQDDPAKPQTNANSGPVTRSDALLGSPAELASTSVLRQRSSNMAGELSFLCPELVVPPECESVLRFPISKPMNSFYVTDLEGNQLLRVEMQVGKASLCACTKDGGYLLAQCVATPVHGSAKEYHLMDANGKYFAEVVEGGLEDRTSWLRDEPLARCTIRTHAHVEWFFLVHGDTCAVEVRDNRGKLIALAQHDEETGARDQLGDVGKPCYSLRVEPLMDVSIVLIGLLVLNKFL